MGQQKMMDESNGGLANVRSRISAAAARAGRAAASVTLVAASKRQPDERIAAALAAGQRVFGENRVQEAAGRWASRRDEFRDLCLHLIGPLQTNKARDAVALFDVIETVDRTALVDALAREARRSIQYFVQVNTGEEPQKSGVAPAGLPDLLAYCAAAGLPVAGLMCIPPDDEPPGPHFALLRKLAARHGLRGLSMGMSDDFERAIGLGATHVRVGSAIFGARA